MEARFSRRLGQISAAAEIGLSCSRRMRLRKTPTLSLFPPSGADEALVRAGELESAMFAVLEREIARGDETRSVAARLCRRVNTAIDSSPPPCPALPCRALPSPTSGHATLETAPRSRNYFSRVRMYGVIRKSTSMFEKMSLEF